MEVRMLPVCTSTLGHSGACSRWQIFCSVTWNTRKNNRQRERERERGKRMAPTEESKSESLSKTLKTFQTWNRKRF